jgi:hypothetical protein
MIKLTLMLKKTFTSCRRHYPQQAVHILVVGISITVILAGVEVRSCFGQTWWISGVLQPQAADVGAGLDTVEDGCPTDVSWDWTFPLISNVAKVWAQMRSGTPGITLCRR